MSLAEQAGVLPPVPQEPNSPPAVPEPALPPGTDGDGQNNPLAESTTLPADTASAALDVLEPSLASGEAAFAPQLEATGASVEHEEAPISADLISPEVPGEGNASVTATSTQVVPPAAEEALPVASSASAEEGTAFKQTDESALVAMESDAAKPASPPSDADNFEDVDDDQADAHGEDDLNIAEITLGSDADEEDTDEDGEEELKLAYPDASGPRGGLRRTASRAQIAENPSPAKRPRKDSPSEATSAGPLPGEHATLQPQLPYPPVQARIDDTIIYSFFEYCAERHRVYHRKEAGVPNDELTEDPLLQKGRYGNVFRQLDRGSAFVRDEVIAKGEQSHTEICFRVFLYCIFSNTETYQRWSEKLGQPPSTCNFDVRAYTKILDPVVAKGGRIYPSSFQLVPPAYVFGGKLSGHAASLRLLQLMLDVRLAERLRKCKYLVDASALVQTIPTLGGFLSLNLLCYLNDSPHINLEYGDFASCGPGTRSALQKIFTHPTKPGGNSPINSVLMEEAGLRWLEANQWKYWARIGVDPPVCPGLPRAGMRVLDFENALCWHHKYMPAQRNAGMDFPPPPEYDASVTDVVGEPEPFDNEVKVEPVPGVADLSVIMTAPEPEVDAKEAGLTEDDKPPLEDVSEPNVIETAASKEPGDTVETNADVTSNVPPDESSAMALAVAAAAMDGQNTQDDVAAEGGEAGQPNGEVNGHVDTQMESAESQEVAAGLAAVASALAVDAAVVPATSDPEQAGKVLSNGVEAHKAAEEVVDAGTLANSTETENDDLIKPDTTPVSREGSPAVPEGQYEVEKIVNHRNDASLYRVRWVGYPPHEDTWEWAATLQQSAADALTEYQAWVRSVSEGIRDIMRRLPFRGRLITKGCDLKKPPKVEDGDVDIEEEVEVAEKKPRARAPPKPKGNTKQAAAVRAQITKAKVSLAVKRAVPARKTPARAKTVPAATAAKKTTRAAPRKVPLPGKRAVTRSTRSSAPAAATKKTTSSSAPSAKKTALAARPSRSTAAKAAKAAVKPTTPAAKAATAQPVSKAKTPARKAASPSPSPEAPRRLTRSMPVDHAELTSDPQPKTKTKTKAQAQPKTKSRAAAPVKSTKPAKSAPKSSLRSPVASNGRKGSANSGRNGTATKTSKSVKFSPISDEEDGFEDEDEVDEEAEDEGIDQDSASESESESEEDEVRYKKKTTKPGKSSSSQRTGKAKKASSSSSSRGGKARELAVDSPKKRSSGPTHVRRMQSGKKFDHAAKKSPSSSLKDKKEKTKKKAAAIIEISDSSGGEYEDESDIEEQSDVEQEDDSMDEAGYSGSDGSADGSGSEQYTDSEDEDRYDRRHHSKKGAASSSSSSKHSLRSSKHNSNGRSKSSSRTSHFSRHSNGSHNSRSSASTGKASKYQKASSSSSSSGGNKKKIASSSSRKVRRH